ncbi:MAG: hypothetical protein HY700_11860 [Gemmatimonadetes bacterium]|nr:hypothetical protein [Gemmatimonadota bacterium]
MATNKKGAVGRRSSALPWIITGAAGVALAVVLLAGRGKAGSHHPEPRADAGTMGETVMPASFFANNPKVLRTYQLARQIPATLDGVYCYCHCKENLGHRSLLTCFQSQHGAGCDVCLDEANIAGEMLAQGRPLAEIRSQIDLAFQR